MDNISELPQEGWPNGVGSRVQAHGPLFESWRVPCGGGGGGGFSWLALRPHSGSLGVLG